jgi:phage terminase large subunit-like protein
MYRVHVCRFCLCCNICTAHLTWYTYYNEDRNGTHVHDTYPTHLTWYIYFNKVVVIYVPSQMSRVCIVYMCAVSVFVVIYVPRQMSRVCIVYMCAVSAFVVICVPSQMSRVCIMYMCAVSHMYTIHTLLI